MKIKILTKKELRKANRLAIKTGCRAIEPEYVKKLPGDCKYPVVFTLPWERQGWVRCQVGTSISGSGDGYMPLWLDVPRDIYENLSTIEVPVDEEVAQ